MTSVRLISKEEHIIPDYIIIMSREGDSDVPLPFFF